MAKKTSHKNHNPKSPKQNTSDNAVSKKISSKKHESNMGLLLSPSERAIMTQNLHDIVKKLKALDILEIKIDEQKFLISIPFEYESIHFLSHIVISAEWALVKTSILELESLSQDSVMELFFEILKGNFILNSVTYSVDPEGKSVWIDADIPLPTELEIFKTQYFSTIFGIDYFLKNISPKIKKNPKPTTNPPPTPSPDSLYI